MGYCMECMYNKEYEIDGTLESKNDYILCCELVWNETPTIEWKHTFPERSSDILLGFSGKYSGVYIEKVVMLILPQ
jgi:hypothetical protein